MNIAPITVGPPFFFVPEDVYSIKGFPSYVGQLLLRDNNPS